jgi:hypothetical protein
MYNICKEQEKYIIIRLSEDILIDAFGIINREFYSSNLKDFNVSNYLIINRCMVV